MTPVIDRGQVWRLEIDKIELVREEEMYLSDRFIRHAFLGLGREPQDIIDYIADCFSVTISLVVAIAVAICMWKFVGAWMAPIAGLGAYAIGIALGHYVILPGHAKR